MPVSSSGALPLLCPRPPCTCTTRARRAPRPPPRRSASLQRSAWVWNVGKLNLWHALTVWHHSLPLISGRGRLFYRSLRLEQPRAWGPFELMVPRDYLQHAAPLRKLRVGEQVRRQSQQLERGRRHRRRALKPSHPWRTPGDTLRPAGAAAASCMACCSCATACSAACSLSCSATRLRKRGRPDPLLPQRAAVEHAGW